MSQSQKRKSVTKENKEELNKLRGQLEKEEKERESKKKSKKYKKWCVCAWLVVCATPTFIASVFIAGGLITIYQTSRPKRN
jgi:hypothetical protein